MSIMRYTKTDKNKTKKWRKNTFCLRKCKCRKCRSEVKLDDHIDQVCKSYSPSSMGSGQGDENSENATCSRVKIKWYLCKNAAEKKT